MNVCFSNQQLEATVCVCVYGLLLFNKVRKVMQNLHLQGNPEIVVCIRTEEGSVFNFHSTYF